MTFAAALLFAACSSTSHEVGALSADSVEIALVDRLDGKTSEYCIDIAGGRENVDPANGLQAHTCYSYTGSLGKDQAFDAKMLVSNALFLPVYNVCAQAESAAAGASVALKPCDGSDLQGFAFAKTGRIQLASNPGLCMTVASETRAGKAASVHQIRALTLEACDDTKSKLQIWKSRTKAD